MSRRLQLPDLSRITLNDDCAYRRPVMIAALRAPLVAEFIEQALAVCGLVAESGGVAAQALHNAIIAGGSRA
jgi:hypothetical protein